ncbi:MAG: thrombospondin type 3 repeat-containing protein [Candidatus Aenigmarchaeota archaeon]|nr:thrombospondin type 3 repeat-containing protein [Candidatus Aenigmarchaeota archaeon]
MRAIWVVVIVILSFSTAGFEIQTIDNADQEFSVYGYTIAATQNQKLIIADISPQGQKTTSILALHPSIWGTEVAYEAPENFINLYYLKTNEDFDTRASGRNPSYARDITAFHTKETDVNIDLNNDGDTNDSVIRYLEVSTKKVINTQAAGENATRVDDFIVFQTPEEQLNTDMNQDGDVTDVIIRTYSIATNQIISQYIPGSPPISSSRTKAAAFITEEVSARTDLNNDGDTEDAIIQYYSPSQGTAHSISFTGTTPSVTDDIVAYSDQGKLNFFNTQTKRLVKTDIAGKAPQISKNAVIYNTGASISYFFSDDTDADGITFYEDNCAEKPNSNQTDTDNDGYGNECDNDDDGDGITDELDNCPVVANSDQKDKDNDKIGDSCDSEILSSNETNQTTQNITQQTDTTQPETTETVQVQEPPITAQIIEVEPTPISGTYYDTDKHISKTIYAITSITLAAAAIVIALWLPGHMRRRRKSFGF